MDIEALLAQVRTPTLILHANKDEVIPLSEGRLLASGIADAEFVELDSRNHASNLFDKLGAWSRAQAIVFARDHGFKH